MVRTFASSGSACAVDGMTAVARAWDMSGQRAACIARGDIRPVINQQRMR
jgi:hypothetical protein